MPVLAVGGRASASKPDSARDEEDSDESGPATIRGLKALQGSGRFSVPKNQTLENLPVALAPPTSTDVALARSRTNSTSAGSKNSRHSVNKGKVQVVEPKASGPGPAFEKDGFVKDLPGVTQEHISQAFQEMDFDHNGFLGVNEIRFMLTVLGEDPTDEELDEMLAMLGGEGDGQVSFEDFLTLFAPSSAVLQEMISQAPREDKRADDSQRPSKKGEMEEQPAMENVGLLIKGAASFLHAFGKKDKDAKRAKQVGLAKAKPLGATRARPQLGNRLLPGQVPGQAVPGQMPGQAPAVPGQLPSQGAGAVARGGLAKAPVPGHLPSMPPLPPGYLIGTKVGRGQPVPGQPGQPGMPPGATPGMPGAPPGAMPPGGLPGQMPGGVPGAVMNPLDPLTQVNQNQLNMNKGPQSISFLEYQEQKKTHEAELARLREQEEDD